MATTFAAPSPSMSSLRSAALTAAAVLVSFLAYSLWVMAGHGPTGFIALAMREPWAMQMLLDLVIACVFGVGWMIRDARRHGITSWPFVVMTIATGSVGLLVYVVRRGVTPRRGT